jgi:hypothetical protein
MESVSKFLQRSVCGQSKVSAEQQNILDEIKEISRLIMYNECWFQSESDSNLIDACIYQRAELNSRYRYLINEAKQCGLSCAVEEGRRQ